MNRNNIIEKYIASVESKFPLYSDDEKQYVDFIKRSMYEYTAENPSFNDEDLAYYFGTPEDIVHDYLLKLETDKLVGKISSQYRNRLMLFIILLLTIVLSIVSILYVFSKYDSSPNDTPATVIEQWKENEQ